MTKLYDERVIFESGGDSGENNAASIQPLAGAEPFFDTAFNRSPQNLRQRSEIIRAALEDLKYFADYDRAFVMRSDATFTLTSGPDGMKLSMSGDDLIIYPALTPGRKSGGRYRGARMFTQQGGSWVGYAGTLGVNDLVFICTGLNTGMRAYADGENFGTDLNALSLGGNRLEMSLVANPGLAGGVGSITAVVSGDPRTKITITYGSLTPTTINDIIAFVAGDTTSQTSYGLAHILRAYTTTLGTVAPPAITDAVFQGAYDAEAHRVTPAQMNAFFAALEGSVEINSLDDGESLLIAYGLGPVEKGPVAPKGGRRQSLFDTPTDRVGTSIDNTSPAVGYALINSGREPEKIAGAIPIGKFADGEFVFIDGTRLPVGASTKLGESPTFLAALADTTPGTSGALLVGYGGSGSWNADAGASAAPLVPPSTVEAAVDNVVGHLANSASTNSGARRVGVEAATGVASTGNKAGGYAAGSVRQTLESLLNTAASATVGGGVNARVSERGHRLHDFDPIEKTFEETTPVNISAGGAHMVRADLGASGATSVGVAQGLQAAFEMLSPLRFSLSANETLNDPETIANVGSSPDRLLLGSFTIARATAVWALLQSCVHTAEGPQQRFLLVRITNASNPLLDGWYRLALIDAAVPEVALVKFDGTAPVFTGITSGDFRVYQGVTFGNSRTGPTINGFHFAATSAPLIDLAVPTAAKTLMRFWNSDTPGTPGAVFYGDKAEWNVAGGAVRSTDNILATADKVLLDGVETGTAVDATANHTHGARYTRWRPLSHTVASWVNAAASQTSFTLLQAAGGDHFIGPAVAGDTVLGYQLEVEIGHDFVDADAAGTVSSYDLRSSPGTVIDPTASVSTMIQRSRAYKPVAGASGVTQVIHVFADCDAARAIAMGIFSDVQVKLTTSYVIVRFIAALTKVA